MSFFKFLKKKEGGVEAKPKVPAEPPFPKPPKFKGMAPPPLPEELMPDVPSPEFPKPLEPEVPPVPEAPEPEVEEIEEKPPIGEPEEMPPLEEEEVPETIPPLEELPIPEFEEKVEEIEPTVSEMKMPEEEFEMPEAYTAIEERMAKIKGPIFVKMTNFREVLDYITEMKTTFTEEETVFESINDIKTRQDSKLAELRGSLEDFERKLLFIDKAIFEQIM